MTGLSIRARIVMTALAGAGLLLLWQPWADAHSFYDTWCCTGNAATGDCSPIPQSSVQPIPGGYQITLKPGDHPRVTRFHVFQIEQSKTRYSPDGRPHVCLYPTEDTLRCVYMPPMGF